MHKLMNLVAIIGLLGMTGNVASRLMAHHASSSSYAMAAAQR
jgi:hypothetical protein